MKKSKLILEKRVPMFKKQISSKIFGCKVFEPKSCCFCHEVEKFVNRLAATNHNPEFC